MYIEVFKNVKFYFLITYFHFESHSTSLQKIFSQTNLGKLVFGSKYSQFRSLYSCFFLSVMAAWVPRASFVVMMLGPSPVGTITHWGDAQCDMVVGCGNAKVKPSSRTSLFFSGPRDIEPNNSP